MSQFHKELLNGTLNKVIIGRVSIDVFMSEAFGGSINIAHSNCVTAKGYRIKLDSNSFIKTYVKFMDIIVEIYSTYNKTEMLERENYKVYTELINFCSKSRSNIERLYFTEEFVTYIINIANRLKHINQKCENVCIDTENNKVFVNNRQSISYRIIDSSKFEYEIELKTKIDGKNVVVKINNNSKEIIHKVLNLINID